MNDEVRGLQELRSQIDRARGQLERAHVQLAEASTASGDLAEAVRLVLDDIVAASKRISQLQEAISDQLAALEPPLRCSRCRSEMVATARRCVRCSAPLAQA